MLKAFFQLSLTLLAASYGTGADWPGFRGDGSGVAKTAKIPTQWDDQTNLRWKVALPGPGSSSPIVCQDRVFVTSYSGYGDGTSGKMEDLKRHLICLDRKTGKELWKVTVPNQVQEDAYRGYITEHGYASTTPVTDGQRVYAFFGKSGVFCYDWSGKEVWKVSVGTDSANRKWGSAGGMILYGNQLIVNASEESRTLRSFDKLTGKELWSEKANSMELCYSTPLIVTPKDGKPQLILSVPGEVWGMNPETGKLRWFAETPYTGNTSPSPVTDGEVVYASGGYPQTGTVAVKIDGENDVTKTKILWKSNISSYVPSPILHDKHLYWVSDRGLACCSEAATGKSVYQERLPLRGGAGASRPVYASVVLAGDQVIAVTRTNGTFVYPVGTEFQAAKVNKLSDESWFNASPAIADNELYLRSNTSLYCIAAKE